MKKTTAWSAAFGISFVWFTTQFGGGFASGAQLKSYFLKYGIWAILIAIGSQAICAVYNWYIAYFARRHHTYNYSAFNNAFYGKYSKIFSPLFELVYIFVLLVVPAVAFATGGTTMTVLTGIPYWLSTLIIGVFIFIVALYGTAIVRKVATLLSILIVVGLVVIFVPNIFVSWNEITANFGLMMANRAETPLLPALWSMLVYAAFQIASSPAIHSQHAEALPEPKDAKLTYWVGFAVNSLMIVLSIFGLMAIIDQPEYATASTPVLVLVQQGPGAALLTPMISILIVLGSVSTAVNMVSAGTARVCPLLDKNYDPDGKPTSKVVIVTLVLCIVGFAVAQFGLLPLVNRGYGILAYLTFPVIMVPYIVHAVTTKCDSTFSGAELEQ